MHYVVGFVFMESTLGEERFNQVSLIKKARPSHLKGYLNGIGGGVERGERPSVAMSREMYEEGGLVVMPDEWYHTATVNTTREDRIDFYAVEWRPDMGELIANAVEDEPVGWYSVLHLRGLNVYPNLHHQIPLALQFLNGKHDYKRIMVTEIA